MLVDLLKIMHSSVVILKWLDKVEMCTSNIISGIMKSSILSEGQKFVFMVFPSHRPSFLQKNPRLLLAKGHTVLSTDFYQNISHSLEL